MSRITIVKPVDFEQFTEAVRQLGLYWMLLNQRTPASDREAPRLRHLNRAVIRLGLGCR